MLICVCFFFYVYGDPRDLHVLTHSVPTRRSSDLVDIGNADYLDCMITTAMAEFGRIDVLFNNAMNVDFDSAGRDTDFLALDPEIFLTSMRTTVQIGRAHV